MHHGDRAPQQPESARTCLTAIDTTNDRALIALATRLGRAEHVRDAAAAVIDSLQAAGPLKRVALLAYGHDGVCRFVSSRGLSPAYREAVEGHCPWKEGAVDAATILVDDVLNDKALEPFRTLFTNEGIGSLAFIPLSTERGVVGKIMLYGDAPGAITPDLLRTAEGAAAFAGVAIGRILALRRLEKSEARFRTLVEGTDVIVWEFDPQRQAFTYVSPQAARFGFPLSDWLKPGFWAQRLHDSDRAEAIRFCTEESTAGRSHRFQYRMHKADGTVVWIDDIVNVERLPGQSTVLRGVMIDITDRKRNEALLIEAQARAEAASRTKSEFLANMSHEIRTPLTAVLGYADLLREDGDIETAPRRRLETIDTIKNAGHHLLTLINDILDLSKIEAERMTVEAVPTPIVTVLLEVESLLASRAAGKGIVLNTVLQTPVPQTVLGDPTRLRQILMNLAGNAIKFTERGTVTLAGRIVHEHTAQRLQVDVTDTGAGMTPEQAGRLFAAFSQADATITRQHGGTGLGLTISRRLARLMGGDVLLARTDIGKGSCFRLDIPIVAVEGSPMVSSIEDVRRAIPGGEAAPLPDLHGRILLAEDGPDNQRLIAYHLHRAGAEVEIAENGRTALEMIGRAADAGTPYDLLITDIQMPEMDGYALASAVRSNPRLRTMPIVALTAHAMAEDRRRCIDAGCDGYASKPIDKAKLLAVCAEWLRKGVATSTVRAAA